MTTESILAWYIRSSSFSGCCRPPGEVIVLPGHSAAQALFVLLHPLGLLSLRTQALLLLKWSGGVRSPLGPETPGHEIAGSTSRPNREILRFSGLCH